jgi:hypothetical protein
LVETAFLNHLRMLWVTCEWPQPTVEEKPKGGWPVSHLVRVDRLNRSLPLCHL